MTRRESMRKYEGIIDLPHYFPKDRVRMPKEKRAAQFMPFAALTGYEAAIANAEQKLNEENSY